MRAARRSTASRPVQFTPIRGAGARIRVRASRWTFKGFVQMARKQRAKQWAEHRRQRDEEEQQNRVMVITEFDAGDPEATMHAMAEAILEYRRALRVLAKAIGWADAGAPFAIIPPGPRWRPRRMLEMPGVAPPAA